MGHGKRLWSNTRYASIGAMVALALSSIGCATHRTEYGLTDRTCVSAELANRFGHDVGPAMCPRQVVYPNGISLDREIFEEEAVLMALWNNAAFLELLTDLGIAQGDLVQAGLLPNPEFVYFFPVSDKPFKYVFEFPIESLWLRPIRIAAAEREHDRVCLRLSQAGLDLIRDTRQAYADVLLARGRHEVALEAVALREKIAQLTKARLDAGDISPQETASARIDASRAEQELERAGFDIGIAEERLRNFMGVPFDRSPLRLAQPAPTTTPLALEPLLDEAVKNRPDALAAKEFAAAAAERLRLTKLGWVRFLGILDATSGRNGHEFGPAFRVTLPIFNRNQGEIARAEAALEKAVRQSQTVENQIALDVQQAHLRLDQGRAEILILREKVLPEVQKAIQRTERAYREGNTPYVVVLQTTQQLIESRLREEQIEADLRRAWADLERSVGRHLDVPIARIPLHEQRDVMTTPVTPTSTRGHDASGAGTIRVP